MSYDKLKEFIDIEEPQRITSSGFTAGDIKTMELLNLVEYKWILSKSGNKPKNPNGFILTDFGKKIVLLSNVDESKPEDILQTTLGEIKAIKDDIIKFKENIAELSNKLDNIETKLESITKPQPIQKPQSKISTKNPFVQLVLRGIRAANPGEFVGKYVKSDYIISYLKEQTSLNFEQINQYLYQLVENEVIQLQREPHITEGRFIIDPNGTEYQLIKINAF